MEGAVVALEVDGEGVVAADEGEVVCAAAVAEVNTVVDGSGVPVADMFAGIGRRVVGNSGKRRYDQSWIWSRERRD